MRLSVATVGLLLGLALVFGSCGEGGSIASNQPVEAGGKATGTNRPAGATSACRRRLGTFVAAMANLRDELARGLSYNQYLGEVTATRTAYARIRAEEVPIGCLFAAGGQAEQAFNLYIEAANDWGDCLATATCRTRSIEPKLQHLWVRAAGRLSLAQAGLRG